MPPIPSLTSAGFYSRPELKVYVDVCRKQGTPLHLMAADLRVSRDRIIYLMSEDGYRCIFRGYVEQAA